ncbi:DNA primase family protein [Crateriforma conspicua]|uniref:SF3 helicase domain-containing protein n=1 Tax=Crateriforma conspicua TaxID=2527996 RepID=A0A5C5XS09_9PLAN|nr:phage/plasmid primase, P4 family [Crateriforma conspicua]TWT65640.1 hypothetical protein Pan14r_51870 [Crateriforma conspicua]
MPRYNIDEIKQAATGRWPEIISAIGRVSQDVLDGRHHPCPKCGGTDRFRLIDKAEGACLCNLCFSEKNGDGVAAVQWLTGQSFGESISAIAGYLGIKRQPVKAINPAEHLEFLDWNPTLAGLWCLKKKPIKPEAIQRVGGRIARYRGQYTVIAIPVLGSALSEEAPIGWVVYRTNGGDLPKWSKGNKTPEWVKVKLTAGSQAGVICNPNTFDCDGEIWKTEGPTDLLTLLSVAPETSAFTTANGSMEKPLEWVIKLCEGRDAIVIHDADKPGQEGATWRQQRDGTRRPGWVPKLAELATRARNLTLPFPVEGTHGPDLRDFFAGGGSMELLRDRLSESEEVTGDTPSDDPIEEAEDDPHRLARVNLERYRSEHEGRLIYWRDEWWKWRDGRYRRIDTAELKAKVSAAIRTEFEHSYRERRARGDDKPIRKVTRALVSNVIGAMESICAIPSSIPMPCWLPDRSQPNYLATSNGILDLDAVFENKGLDESLRPHSSDWLSSFKLNYPFDPAATCDIWEEYLRYSLEDDQERIQLLQEWAGYLLTSQNEHQKFLVLEGEGGNGKTVYFAAMTAMLGPDNVSHVSIENFGGRFELGSTIGKSANISGDAGEVDTVAEGILKQFCGGDVMQFDRKNLPPISARPTAKLMAAWNTRPRMRDKSMGLWRRMILVPFNRIVEPHRRVLGMDKPDWWIENGQAPGILNWAIVGLARLRERGRFTTARASSEAIEEYRQDSNPAMRFLTECVSMLPPEMLEQELQKPLSEQHAIHCDELYVKYRDWCQDEAVKPLAKQNFGKQVRRVYGDTKHRRGTRNERFFVYRLICYTGEFF